ncbi:zinc-binding alcohol dehydrogenase family protein [Roseibium sp. CAU 1637]|uniref:Zinc-binding alcohol dehydrogenase family protein n=1 Tax=Roseibium limicola TaxID=2816037 RepID=A0A939EJW4_9HYPH|nr:zinc-binding alcohol dehydrogenase family protein [Roseibium limicola]MBO0344005.1 zinc-binding alcohol dehydrogenase family protein [Roseibium limicola]
MDALVCVEPGRLEVRDVAAPGKATGQVLVHPKRVGICGTDYHIFEGKHPFLQYPRIMGHELAVEVVEAPDGSGFQVGEICAVNPYLSCGTCHACSAGKPNCCMSISVLGVHGDGGMTEMLCLPVENLVRAEGLSTDACATVEFLAIGAHAVRRGAVQRGEKVLVVGAGPIGLGAALFARIAGADVTMLDLDAERLSSVCGIAGAAPLVLPSGSAPKDVVQCLTEGNGFDVVFDATGNGRSMEAGFDYVAHGGRLVLVSVVTSSISFSDPDFHRKEMTLIGSRNATSEDFAHVIACIRSGQVPVERLITHRTSLHEAVENLPKWAHAKDGLIKAVIEIV